MEDPKPAARSDDSPTAISVMSSDVECVAADTPLREAAARMAQRNISCAVVVDAARRPLGILTERDLVGVLAEDRGADRVDSVMSAPVHGVGPDASVAACVAECRSHRIRRLAVVDGQGGLQGILTQSDLLEVHLQGLELLVRARTRDLECKNIELENVSRKDPLLGVRNRLALDEDHARLHQSSARYGRPYSLILFDVDHFKQVNDSHGHEAGDRALQGVCARIDATLRNTDTLYRLGGDEFLALLPETDAAGSRPAAQRVRLAVALESEELWGITLSSGVASFDPAAGAPDAEALVRSADAALYEAKAAGRDCVRHADDLGKPSADD